MRRTFIYEQLYKKPRAKHYFAEKLSLSTKSIENITKEFREDVIYDRKLGKYRFASVLPAFVPTSVFMHLLGLVVGNEHIREDVANVTPLLRYVGGSEDHGMIPTSILCPLFQRIISGYLAIGSNAILKISYKSPGKSSEYKYIKPHTIATDNGIFYLHASYDKRNKKDIGEHRVFSFSRMISLEAVEFDKDEIFLVEKEAGAYGYIDEGSKEIKVLLSPQVADIFKKEKKFKSSRFTFIDEDERGNITASIKYANIMEVERLIQEWMPHIKILETAEENENTKKELFRKIRENCDKATGEADGKILH